MQGLSPALEKFRNVCSSWLCEHVLYQLIAGSVRRSMGAMPPPRQQELLNNVTVRSMLHRSE